MKINGKAYRTIWLAEDGQTVQVIDQTRLPHQLDILEISDVPQMCDAIYRLVVRGAPLIGVSAAYGLAIAMRLDPSDSNLEKAYQDLLATRPTAVNLRWALDDMRALLTPLPPEERRDAAYGRAGELADEDARLCYEIGRHGMQVIAEAAANKAEGEAVNILTHCNAGWLATVDWGTALSPIYQAYDAGIPVHVWVDETRPRNQGASLTAFELGSHGVPHTVIVDNVGGHLMQHGMVDLCITGTDRTAASGDVCNKIGTYLKALAAKDNDVPFYITLPYSTIDWNLKDGVRDIPIEERDPKEVTMIAGMDETGQVREVRLTPETSPAANYAFDVTPGRLITGLITERGICDASEEGLLGLYPEQRKN